MIDIRNVRCLMPVPREPGMSAGGLLVSSKNGGVVGGTISHFYAENCGASLGKGTNTFAPLEIYRGADGLQIAYCTVLNPAWACGIRVKRARNIRVIGCEVGPPGPMTHRGIKGAGIHIGTRGYAKGTGAGGDWFKELRQGNVVLDGNTVAPGYPWAFQIQADSNQEINGIQLHGNRGESLYLRHARDVAMGANEIERIDVRLSTVNGIKCDKVSGKLSNGVGHG